MCAGTIEIAKWALDAEVCQPLVTWLMYFSAWTFLSLETSAYKIAIALLLSYVQGMIKEETRNA